MPCSLGFFVSKRKQGISSNGNGVLFSFTTEGLTFLTQSDFLVASLWTMDREGTYIELTISMIVTQMY